MESEPKTPSADALPQIRVERAQPASGGALYITYTDCFVKVPEHGEPFSHCRHLATGKTLEIPNEFLWRGWDRRLGSGGSATDYSLPVAARKQSRFYRNTETDCW